MIRCVEGSTYQRKTQDLERELQTNNNNSHFSKTRLYGKTKKPPSKPYQTQHHYARNVDKLDTYTDLDKLVTKTMPIVFYSYYNSVNLIYNKNDT